MMFSSQEHFLKGVTSLQGFSASMGGSSCLDICVVSSAKYFLYILYSCWNNYAKDTFYEQQKCIPVRCLPPALVAVTRCQFHGGLS